jgi:hypothetical protein
VQACQCGIGNLHLRLDVGTAEAPLHDALDTFAYLGVVAVARHEDQAGIEAAVTVAAHEQACATAFVQVDDAADDGNEFRGGHLEQLVARKGLDDIDHRLGVVALRRQAEVFDDRLELAAQQWDLAGR